MTAGDIVFAVEAYAQQANVTITIDRGVVLTCLNEAVQQLYPIMLMTDDSFWTASQAMSAGGTVNYPANYRTTRAIEITNAAIGGARKVGHREWQSVLNNSSITATNDDPIYRQDATSLQIAPGTAGVGVHYYLRTIPEITDYTQDLFSFSVTPPAQCQWAFQEALILATAHLVTLRETVQPEVPESEVTRMFEIAERFKAMYDQAKRPLAIFAQNTQRPMISPDLLEKEPA